MAEEEAEVDLEVEDPAVVVMEAEVEGEEVAAAQVPYTLSDSMVRSRLEIRYQKQFFRQALLWLCLSQARR